jgi:hypothetical protein
MSSRENILHPEETSQNCEHPESSGGVGDLPGPPDEFGVAIPPDERMSSQENILHPESAMAKDQSQHLSNDATPQNDSPKEKEVPHLPEERESVGASSDASTSLLSWYNLELTYRTGTFFPFFPSDDSPSHYFRRKFHC